MTEDAKPTNTLEDAEFLFSVIEIELEHWGNDIAGTKAVLMALGCADQKAEAVLGSYLCRRFDPRHVAGRRGSDVV